MGPDVNRDVELSFSWVISYHSEEYIVIAFCLRLMNKMRQNLIKIISCAIYWFIKFYQFSAPPHFYGSPSFSSINIYRLDGFGCGRKTIEMWWGGGGGHKLGVGAK